MEAKTESRNQILTESPRQNGECVRVSLDQFKGFENIHIRIWKKADADDDTYSRPSYKGIALRPDVAELEAVIEGLTKACELLEGRMNHENETEPQTGRRTGNHVLGFRRCPRTG